MIAFLTDTGFGSCLILLIGVVGIPAAIWWDKRTAKKMPGVGAPGETNR